MDSQGITHQFQLPKEVHIFCQSLRKMYTVCSIQPECWPNASISNSLNKQYIELNLIKHRRSIDAQTTDVIREQQENIVRGELDKIYVSGTVTKITLEQMFETSESPLKILLDGAPGTGKTTLSRKACFDWANNRLLSQYYLVMLLNLRNCNVAKASTVDDLIHHEDGNIKQAVLKHIKCTDGEGVLIIFEGFDELSAEERHEHSFILKFIKGEVLSKCSIFVTSRSYASEPIHRLKCINRHVQVIGFRQKQIRECIKQVIDDQEKAEELCALMDERSDLEALCCSPLNCAILLFVYQTNRYHLPKTLTKLYELLIIHLLKRCGEVGNFKEWPAINTLDSLPCTPDFCLKCTFEDMCQLAYVGLKDDKLVFEEKEIVKAFETSSNNHTRRDRNLLNLMSTAKSFSMTGPTVLYNFIHLTLQEFLASFWISRFGDHRQFFHKYFCNLNDHCRSRFKLLILFVSGITKLKFQSALPDLKNYLSQQMKKDAALLEVCHVLYESDQSLSADSCMNLITESGTMSYFNNDECVISSNSSAFDCIVVANFLAFCNLSWSSLQMNSKHIKPFCTVFSGMDQETNSVFNKLVLTVDEDGLFDLHFLKQLSLFSHVEMQISLSEHGSTSLGMTPKTKFGQIKSIGLYNSIKSLKIHATQSIFPDLLCKIAKELKECTLLDSLYLKCLNVVRIEDDDSMIFGLALNDSLQSIHLKDFHLDLGQFMDQNILHHVLDGLSSNESLESVSIGQLSLDLAEHLFDNIGNYSEIRHLQVHVGSKEGFGMFEEKLKQSRLMQNPSLSVTFCCGQQKYIVRTGPSIDEETLGRTCSTAASSKRTLLSENITQVRPITVFTSSPGMIPPQNSSKLKHSKSVELAQLPATGGLKSKRRSSISLPQSKKDTEMTVKKSKTKTTSRTQKSGKIPFQMSSNIDEETNLGISGMAATSQRRLSETETSNRPHTMSLNQRRMTLPPTKIGPTLAKLKLSKSTEGLSPSATGSTTKLPAIEHKKLSTSKPTSRFVEPVTVKFPPMQP